MTLQKALRTLGLSAIPATEQELRDALQRKVRAGQIRMRMPAAKVSKDRVIQELKDAQDAFNFLKPRVTSRAAPRRTSAASKRTTSQRNRPRRPRPVGTTGSPPPRPRPFAAPNPQPQTSPQSVQAAPRPPTLPPNAWRWIYTALGAVAVLFVLIHVSRLGLNDDSEQEYGYIVVPVTDYRGGHRFGTHKADSAINALSDKAQACWVKFLSFPVAQVSVDGEDTAEAPAPTWHRVMPGQHVFKFWSSSPGESVEWRDTLKEGVRYLVKADLGQQTYSVSEVADP